MTGELAISSARAPPFSMRHVALGAAMLSLAVLGAWLCRAWVRTLTFDDAFMFYRYALNVRHGLGVSWNPDGVPTYGMTSLLWIWFVLPATALPLSPGHALQVLSWLVGAAALVTMAATVVHHARSDLLRFPPLAFSAVALPLALNPVFAFHLTTGMDTVVSLLANAALVFETLEYVERPIAARALATGTLAFVAVLARPDNGVCALGVPLLTWMLLPGRKRWEDLVGLSALPVALIGAELLLCKRYFGVPVPLGFYAKSLHTYAGFQSSENAVHYAYMAVSCALPYVGVLGATLMRRRWRTIAAFLLPVAVTTIYLLTVRQVMGFGGRYYIPFLPFVVVPALISVDEAAAEGTATGRRLIAGIAIAAVLYVALRPLELRGERLYRHWVVSPPIAVPSLPVAATRPLESQYNPIKQPGIAQVVAALPRGSVVAATEVGYLGSVGPDVTIIDLAGLNDTQIATRGFSMDGLLARAPDLIWLPHSHYTGMRAVMLADPRLFERYAVFAGVFGYGIAIRRDSPSRRVIEEALQKEWPKLYPSRNLADYVVPQGYAPGPTSEHSRARAP